MSSWSSRSSCFLFALCNVGACNDGRTALSSRTTGQRGPAARGTLGSRGVARFTALLFVSIAAGASAQLPCAGIHVQVLDIRNSTGTVACALFESADGFPKVFLRSATNVMVIKVRKAQARCTFEDIPPGTYAIAAIHDENMNGELDANWMPQPSAAPHNQCQLVLHRACAAGMGATVVGARPRLDGALPGDGRRRVAGMAR